jgi:hypothetical protein
MDTDATETKQEMTARVGAAWRGLQRQLHSRAADVHQLTHCAKSYLNATFRFVHTKAARHRMLHVNMYAVFPAIFALCARFVHGLDIVVAIICQWQSVRS